MTAAILRGSSARGYRTSSPLACPHCGTGYTDAELRHVYAGPPVATGVVLPQPPRAGRLVNDPVPTFEDERQ